MEQAQQVSQPQVPPSGPASTVPEKKDGKGGIFVGACLILLAGIVVLFVLVVAGLFLWNKLVLKRAEVAFSDLFSSEIERETGVGEDFGVPAGDEFSVEELERQVTVVPTEVKQGEKSSEVSGGMMTYSNSTLGFQISYPKGWRAESTIDDYSTISSAEVQGGNHFHIYSYPADRYSNPGLPVPSNELKVEVWLFEAMDKTINEWASEPVDVIKTEDMVIDGNKAIKVWEVAEMVGEIMTIYYMDGDRGAMIISWPHDTAYLSEFDEIVKSFKFTN